MSSISFGDVGCRLLFSSRVVSAITPMIDIKETVSHHCVSLNRLECGRPILDVSMLSKLLGDLIKDEDAPVVVGKKRHVENTNADNAPSKR